ncbi:hypothetical protein DFP94_101615 [Fontibacillus phaseoli]|uniref:YgiT-type zinc finger domain-containing protein n=1 Tax=Fontibacillus phaseoli TaxID=1416533 RepID=A0A369BTT1_9BACL|nr:hypothetical protein [Fontibacillus phaseoli]RCX23024.1 hypothetical protein DFP94_101615 [Fontibacillus phaseoli]
MRKHCRCGQKMNLGFRLVIFENKFQVDRVPILECDECDYYEVLPFVKADVIDLLEQLKQQGENVRVFFTDMNELADVLYDMIQQKEKSDSSSFEAVLEQKCNERINLLLDLYGCAQKMNDSSWMNVIAVRLAVLSKYVSNRQSLSAK